MALYKRAHVRGINHELVRQGLISWPTEKIADEAADAVADELPEEEIPEVTGEEGLSAEDAANVIDQLVDVAEEIAAKTGGVRDESFPKLAASVGYETAANAHATALIYKAAAEGDGTDVTGDGRFQEEMMASGMGDIDARENPSAEVVGPQGTTSLDTSPGEVGAQTPQNPPPGASAETPSEVAKLSYLVEQLLKKKADTNPGSGDTSSPGHTEPSDNQTMSGVAPAQGHTTHPKGPMMGEQTPQERADAVSTSGEVAKLSSLLKNALSKLSEDEESAEEEKKEEEEEEAKEAALASAIQALSKYVTTSAR